MDKLLVKEITDNIYDSIVYTLKSNSCASDNCWVDDYYNVTAETGVDLDDNNKIEKMYLIMKLEEYDGNDKLINDEIDYIESENMERSSVFTAIEILLTKNEEVMHI